ncbi:MAG: hypothetical protein JW841_03165 [Deltaproteobacteria bacterium]|nr:hypothetical protein [Deltaproteobacteria bacterium]
MKPKLSILTLVAAVTMSFNLVGCDQPLLQKIKNINAPNEQNSCAPDAPASDLAATAYNDHI